MKDVNKKGAGRAVSKKKQREAKSASVTTSAQLVSEQSKTEEKVVKGDLSQKQPGAVHTANKTENGEKREEEQHITESSSATKQQFTGVLKGANSGEAVQEIANREEVTENTHHLPDGAVDSSKVIVESQPAVSVEALRVPGQSGGERNTEAPATDQALFTGQNGKGAGTETPRVLEQLGAKESVEATAATHQEVPVAVNGEVAIAESPYVSEPMNAEGAAAAIDPAVLTDGNEEEKRTEASQVAGRAAKEEGEAHVVIVRDKAVTATEPQSDSHIPSVNKHSNSRDDSQYEEGDRNHKAVIFQEAYKRLRSEERKFFHNFNKALVTNGAVVRSAKYLAVSGAARRANEVIHNTCIAMKSAIRDIKLKKKNADSVLRAKKQFDSFTPSITVDPCEIVKDGLYLIQHSIDMRNAMVSSDIKALKSKLKWAEDCISKIENENKTPGEDAEAHAGATKRKEQLRELHSSYKAQLQILDREISCLNQEIDSWELLQEERERYDSIAKLYRGNERFATLYSGIMVDISEGIEAFAAVLNRVPLKEREDVLAPLIECYELLQENLTFRIRREGEIEAHIRTIEAAITARFTNECSIYSLKSYCNETKRESDKSLFLEDGRHQERIRGDLDVHMHNLYQKETEHEHILDKNRADIKGALEELEKLTNTNAFLRHGLSGIHKMQQLLVSKEFFAKANSAVSSSGLSAATNLQQALSQLKDDVDRCSSVLSVANRNCSEVNSYLADCMRAVHREEYISKLLDMRSFKELLQEDENEIFSDASINIQRITRELPTRGYVEKLRTGRQELGRYAEGILFSSIKPAAEARVIGAELCHILKDPDICTEAAQDYRKGHLRLEDAIKEKAAAERGYAREAAILARKIILDRKDRNRRIYKALSIGAASAFFIGVTAFSCVFVFTLLPTLGVGLWILPHVITAAMGALLVAFVYVVNRSIEEKLAAETETVAEKAKDAKEGGILQRVFGVSRSEIRAQENVLSTQKQVEKVPSVAVVPGAESEVVTDSRNSLVGVEVAVDAAAAGVSEESAPNVSVPADTDAKDDQNVLASKVQEDAQDAVKAGASPSSIVETAPETVVTPVEQLSNSGKKSGQPLASVDTTSHQQVHVAPLSPGCGLGR